MSQLNPPGFLYRNALIYMGWLLSKTDYTSKGTNLYVTTPYFHPSCGARRMAESAALLVDEVLPEQPMRQWVLSFPFQLRFLFGVVCGKGRNPTLRLWPAIFSGEIDVFPGDRRSRLISSMTSVAPA